MEGRQSPFVAIERSGGGGGRRRSLGTGTSGARAAAAAAPGDAFYAGRDAQSVAVRTLLTTAGTTPVGAGGSRSREGPIGGIWEDGIVFGNISRLMMGKEMTQFRRQQYLKTNGKDGYVTVTI